MIAAATTAAALTLSHPRPDPAPDAGKGPITWVAYDFVAWSMDGTRRYRCHVPVRGRRACVLIGRRHP